MRKEDKQKYGRSLKDGLLMLAILCCAFFISLLFQHIFKVQEHITTIFVFAVFLISIFTEGFLYGIISAFLGTLAVNYAFAFPYFALDFAIPVNLISGIIMVAIAVFTSAIITKLKNHEAVQIESERETMRANLLRAVSHDLRTPLTAINGYLDLLEREEKSENVQRYLSQIQNRTEVLKNLTEELFRYSVVTSSQDLKLERMDVVRALEESLLSFYAVMQENGIQPEIELPEEPVFRELDAGAVNRIFSNIISNALKYSDGDLSVVMDKSGCVTFSNTAHNLNAVTVGRLFDRFFTVEASRNSTGLGLSIAKLLIERMGGTIIAEYQNGKLNIVINFRE